MSPSSPSTGACSAASIPAGRSRAALLWTDRPALMEIPAESLDSANRRIAAADRPCRLTRISQSLGARIALALTFAERHSYLPCSILRFEPPRRGPRMAPQQ